jgi:hypothetical protein
MTWRPCSDVRGYPPHVYIVHRAECLRGAKQGKVPPWTAEDEANLARRVRARLNAKPKP